MKAQDSRLYYIDWLRILAFGLLFLFHSWRPFDHYSWNIKNAEQSNIFDLLTFFTHGWRMDLIFLISGVGTWFSLNSRKSSFFSDRIKRLIIPFIFGIVFIIPPQKFYEAISFHGFQGDYFQFIKAWPIYAFSQNFGASVLFWFGHLGAHIYYLPYLFTMTVLVVPVYKMIQNRKFSFDKLYNLIVTPRGVFLLILPLITIRYSLKPLFPGYTDWADFFSYMFIFIYGFILIRNPRFVETVRQLMWLFLNIAIISNVLLFYYINQNDANMQIYLKPGYGFNHLYLSVLSVLISFCWVMFFVGLAAKKLNFNHKFIQPANTAILPIYILHQTLIVVFGFYIIQFNTSIIVKYLLIAGTAIPSAILLYLGLKRFSLMRLLFGLKPEAKNNTNGMDIKKKLIPVNCSIINHFNVKSIKRFFLIVTAILVIAPVYSQNRKTHSNLNILGAGYGIEYFISPKVSLFNELGLSYWGKINDKIQGEEIYSDKAFLNPYFLSSFRYYFVPLHQIKNGKSSIGWRISTTYTGLYTFKENYQNKTENSHQLGVFAGTSIHLPENFYIDLELGPGYDFGNLNSTRFNLFGNIGFGYRF